MDIEIILNLLDFPSEQLRTAFKQFYEYLQDYMQAKKTNPDEFNKIDYLQNLKPECFQFLMKHYVEIFHDTLLLQHKEIFSNWRIWDIIFRRDLAEFFCDYADFEVFKRNKIIGTQKDLNAQSEKGLPKTLFSSTPISTSASTSQGISLVLQKRVTRLSTKNNTPNSGPEIGFDSTTRQGNISDQVILLNQGPNVIPNQTELLQPLPEDLRESFPVLQPQQIGSVPSTPRASTRRSSTSSLSIADPPVRRVYRKKKQYDIVKDVLMPQNVHITYSNPLKFVQLNNHVYSNLSTTELRQSRSTPIKSIQIDDGRFDEFFDAISDAEEDLNQISTMKTNTNYVSVEPTMVEYIMPDLPRGADFEIIQESLRNLNQPTQNILSDIEAINGHFADLNDSVDNEIATLLESNAIADGAAEAPEIQNTMVGETIVQLHELSQHDPERVDVSHLTQITDNQNLNHEHSLIQDNQNLIQNNENVNQDNQDIFQLQQSTSQIQVENEIIQEEIADDYRNKNWIKILRDRRNTNNINMNAFIRATNRKKRKRRHANIMNNANLIEAAAPSNEQQQVISTPHIDCAAIIPENINPRDSFLNMTVTDDLQQINISPNQTPAELGVSSQAEFKAKFIKWKDSYLNSYPGKYQKYLKYSADDILKSSSDVYAICEILKSYTLKESDIIPSTELFPENLPPDVKQRKKRVLRGLKDHEIIKYLNSDTAGEDDTDSDVLFTLEH